MAPPGPYEYYINEVRETKETSGIHIWRYQIHLSVFLLLYLVLLINMAQITFEVSETSYKWTSAMVMTTSAAKLGDASFYFGPHKPVKTQLTALLVTFKSKW
jgi:hypothetical protein